MSVVQPIFSLRGFGRRQKAGQRGCADAGENGFCERTAIQFLLHISTSDSA